MRYAKPIELLSPAKNADTGIEAIRHGADAVYIGAHSYGARQAAGNSVAEIARLIRFAHLYHARVYVTVNTLLTDDELPHAQQLIGELYRAQADAILVQDMALLQMQLPPIPLHASTQCDVRTAQKVQFLEEAGISQVVLARELSLDEIKEIARHATVPLEAFVHGALCVSLSGQCYASQYCFGRSANRGECAQFCRLPFDLVDGNGRTLLRGKHLLSLKDMNRSHRIEDLLEAGISSLKIEGRLKEESYVKNITAWYHQKLNEAIARQPNRYRRPSSGSVQLAFAPDPAKSFNRGFTDYLLDGKKSDIFSFDTPKARGEEVGRVKEATRSYLRVAGSAAFANGDGLCFVDEGGKLRGFRVNRVEGNKLYPHKMPPGLVKGATLYRNHSQEFEQQLARPTAERTIAVEMELRAIPFGYALSLTDEEGTAVTVALAAEKQEARTPQEEPQRATLTKLGDTPYRCTRFSSEVPYFIPASQLAALRRRATERLTQNRLIAHRVPVTMHPATTHPYPQKELTYLGNVLNRQAALFYRQHGVERCDFAFEKRQPAGSTALMFCRHCIKYSFGRCPREAKGGQSSTAPLREPLTLVSADGKKFRLEFDCKACIMKVYS